MKCPNCGYRDNFRTSRFDFNAEYIRFDESEDEEIKNALAKAKNFEPYEKKGLIYYRRGTGGLWLYRVAKEDFRMPRERKNHRKETKPSP